MIKSNLFRHGVFAAAGLALFAAAAVSFAIGAALRGIERAVLFAFDFLARPGALLPAGYPVGTDQAPRSFYSSPDIHSLRHEAGTSKRAAARGV